MEIYREQALRIDSKIVLLVMDGLGGLPHPDTGLSELETARTPNFDRLAAASALGLSVPVKPGITPGSGPSHLALFGYEPISSNIGRGALEAVGIDFPLTSRDVAARGNFCTVDAQGLITDRRAGRISSEECRRLCDLLRPIRVPGIEVFVEPVREHRFVVIFRGNGLGDNVPDTDPQREGVPPREPTAGDEASEATARAAAQFIAQARQVLASQHPANMLTLRGFARSPHLPNINQQFNLRAGAIAVYPMYRGLARIVGMEVVPTGGDFAAELVTLRERWHDFDFFYVHFKGTDKAGEDGDFDAKVRAIEEVDACLPDLLALRPDVLVVTGDHSTPAIMAAHSWHPVPFLLASRLSRPDDGRRLTERECARGNLGQFPALDAMPLMLAHAGRLEKFGA